jgi:hypothetical protein
MNKRSCRKRQAGKQKNKKLPQKLVRQAPGSQGINPAFLFGFLGVSIIFACPNDRFLNNLWSGGPAG